MINCIGVNYKHVPLDIREKYAFSEEEQKEFHGMLRREYGIVGSVLLSTCNRSEIYFCGEREKEVIRNVETALTLYKRLSIEEVLNSIYVYGEEKALQHLFRVTSGLDSMVLGEDEILRQVKEGYQLALEAGVTCPALNIAFQGAMSSAKSIKTETRLSRTAVSTGTLAANRIEVFLKETGGARVLIVGITGKIGSILAKNLYGKGIRNLVGTSRKHGTFTAERFLNERVPIVDFSARYELLDEMDVIVSASTSPHYTFTAEKVRDTLQTKKPRLFLDMAVPRDMDIEIAGLPDCRLIDIDDFQKMAVQNHETKLGEVEKAEVLLAKKLDETRKSIYMSEFMEQKRGLFEELQNQEFASVFYRLKDRLSGEHFKALIEALDETGR